jgi:hypothetical protein
MSTFAFLRSPIVVAAAVLLPGLVVLACSSKTPNGFGTGGGSGASGSGANGTGAGTSSGNPTGTGGNNLFGDSGLPDSPQCAISCSNDRHSVIDCDGGTVVSCMAGQACDLSTGGCSDACTAATNNKQSVGCDYYATRMEMDYADQCYAAFIANTWNTPAHISVEFYPGTPLDVATFGRIPSGTGSNVTYTAYDDTAGLAPGEVAVLFLGGSPGSTVPCPAAANVTKTAIPLGSLVQGTGMTHSFHITTDVPVVAYQMNPFGGGSAAITGASLLLPTSVWDTNYVAVTAAGYATRTMDNPSFNIIASQDNTTVTMLPNAAIVAGNGLPAGPANMQYTFTLSKGEQAQFSQQADLTGTVIQANNPIGFMAGNACMDSPIGTDFCDHGEQMLPPVKALGNEYVGVMYRPRVTGDKAMWRLIGAVNGTTLSYEPSTPAGAPTTLSAGEDKSFQTDQPFVVKSQDTSHPFMMFTYMPGSQWSGLGANVAGGYGDPDFVLGVTPQQYLNDYVFFTDPTYPETNIVLVRTPDKKGTFQDVTLDCVTGPLTGWTAIGKYEWTRVDLTRHNFQNQGNCSTGRHEVKSDGLYGLWVWGWGSAETQGGTCQPNAANFTCYVSYGYPGGMNVAPINGVVIPPMVQ